MFLQIVFVSLPLIYSHIHHSFPIATLCYIVLSDFSALDFALMIVQNKGNIVWNHIKN